MDNETQKILEEQVRKLPKEVVSFLSSSNWDSALDEIGAMYNLSEDQLYGFKREAVLVLAGIVHPDAFRASLEQETGITGAVLLDAMVTMTETRIFASVRSALVQFFNDERAQAEAHGEFAEESSVSVVETPAIGMAPANIPTEVKEESFLPPLIPKVMTPTETKPEIAPMHPFEEKMRESRANTPVPTSGFSIPATFTPETSAPMTPEAPRDIPTSNPAQNTSPRGTFTHDPYREPVE